MDVAIPTAIPLLPFTKRLGNLAGRTTGSFSSSSKFGIKSTVSLSISVSYTHLDVYKRQAILLRLLDHSFQDHALFRNPADRFLKIFFSRQSVNLILIFTDSNFFATRILAVIHLSLIHISMPQQQRELPESYRCSIGDDLSCSVHNRRRCESHADNSICSHGFRFINHSPVSYTHLLLSSSDHV